MIVCLADSGCKAANYLPPAWLSRISAFGVHAQAFRRREEALQDLVQGLSPVPADNVPACCSCSCSHLVPPQPQTCCQQTMYALLAVKSLLLHIYLAHRDWLPSGSVSSMHQATVQQLLFALVGEVGQST